MPDFAAAIFDLDGTLIDSMTLWEKIATDFLKSRRLEVPENYISELCPMTMMDSAAYTVSLFHLPEKAEDVAREWNEMAIEHYRHRLRLKPFVKEYLLYLKAAGVKLSIATASSKVLYEAVLRNNGIYDYFDAFASVDEVSRGKGHPDIYLLAAKRLDVLPKGCMVFEDILAGIVGAKAAGMKACGVYDICSAHEKSQMEKLADRYILGFNELLPSH